MDPIEARDRVGTPSAALVVLGVLCLLWDGLGLLGSGGVAVPGLLKACVAMLVRGPDQVSDVLGGAVEAWIGVAGAAGSFVGLLLAGLMILGGVRMRALRSPSLSFGGAAAAMVHPLMHAVWGVFTCGCCTSPCWLMGCLLAWPVGAMALVVLLDPGVRAAFVRP